MKITFVVDAPDSLNNVSYVVDRIAKDVKAAFTDYSGYKLGCIVCVPNELYEKRERVFC
jgi:hypothetical protein